ncbi:MAG: 16S rRNA (cytosine(967)-C(5))-methyltransferase RsmB [Clostridia bacterium]|nr:16S rRNA (cytosine(967)-C(5))-methyltransferase RsmB [Clostridia bacterium]
MIDKARALALEILYKIDKEQGYSNIVLNEEIKQNRKKLNDKDIGLISEIVYGVTTWRLTLDEIIKKYSKIKLKKISVWILNILRMGIYQINFLDKVPKSAAVNESVNLAKRYGHSSSANFVNAILRKIEKKDYEELFQITDDIERISKTTSMPEWIIKELLKNNNIDKVERICECSNLKPKVTIRINKLKITKKELLKKLQEQGINYKETNYDDFLILEKVKDIENLDLFKNGFFTIQDISAGLTAQVLQPQKGDYILDACSAPGGKTTYIAELMENDGIIEAWDIYEHRTKLVTQNADRLGINIIKTDVKDASIYDKSLNEKFDKILLDVPCLGIGVIKRKPDIKWQRKIEDIKEITKVQQSILENCSKYLKKGSTLVYSTCSILKEENEDVIYKFLNENKDFEIIENSMINIIPDEEKDGFFICKLRKK